MADWGKYLNSVCDKYSKWWETYAPLDAECASHRMEEHADPRLQFDLLVQTLKKPEEREATPPMEEPHARERVEKLNVLEALRKYADNHVLLVGRPGSGKTTALLRLLLEEAEKAKSDPEARIPVLLELKHYTDTAEKLIFRFIKNHGMSLRKDSIEKALAGGSLLLLLDGLNELPSEASRSDLLRFRAKYDSTTPMVFTTRDIALGGGLSIPKELEILPLSEEQIKQFAGVYLEDRADSFLRCLKGNLRKMGETPLFLWMLCAVFWAEEDKLPSNLGEVFRRFTESYEKGIKADAPVSQESRLLWPALLQRLAFEMMHGPEPTNLRLEISRKEAEGILYSYLKEAEYEKPLLKSREYLTDLLNHHLIRITAEDKIEFNHQLIQEYYAAEHLLELLPDLLEDEISFKENYLNYLKWTEPMALMLGFVEQKIPAKRIVNIAIETDIRLGARLAGSVKEEFQPEMIGFISGKDISNRLKVFLLEESGSKAAVPALSSLLSDEDSYVQWRAARALGEIGGGEAIEALKEALHHEDSYVRWRATSALGDIGGGAAIATLKEALHDEDSDVRCSSASALGQIGGFAAIAALKEALHHEDSDVRCSSASALGDIGDVAALAALKETLHYDENSGVRSIAASALGRIGGFAAKVALLEALNQKDPEVQLRAAYALGGLHVGAARAAGALGKIGGVEVIEALREALHDEDSYVRSSVADALGEIGGRAAIEALKEALDNEDSGVRWRAAEALGNIGSAEDIKWLKGLLFGSYKEDSQIAEVISKIQQRCGYYDPFLVESRSFNILHLSDLHFGTKDDANIWHTQLIYDLSTELECSLLDAVVISGDVGNFSEKEEYGAAAAFLKKLLNHFGISPERLIIVPGNHDLNWGISEKASQLKQKKAIERNRKRRFQNFVKFYEEMKGEAYPLEYEDQGIISSLPGGRFLFLGLNSAWRTDHQKTADARINMHALSSALDNILGKYDGYTKIAVWHHPLVSPGEDRIKDHGFMELLAQAGFRMVLHGHVHKAENSLYRYDQSAGGRKIEVVAAGTFGAATRDLTPGYPWQYNLIRIERKKVRVYTRRREEENGAWKPDARWLQGPGKDPLPYYEFEL